MSMNERVKSLIAEIKVTNEYVTLIKTRTVIDKNSVLKKRLTDFNKKQNETFEGRLSSKDFDLKAKELDVIYNELIKIKEIDDFMKASEKFDDLVTQIYKNINDSVYS